jgi:sugar phosphate isomerase/epimerase
MQYDIGNSIHGGADPIAILKRFPARTTTIHLKEYSKTNPNALTGEGDVPWKEVFRLCEEQGGTKWYIVEQESYAVTPLEAVALCLQNLRKMGK